MSEAFDVSAPEWPYHPSYPTTPSPHEPHHIDADTNYDHFSPIMTTLTSSSKSDQGDMVTAFPFLTDQERDAVNALLSMPTAPRPSTAGTGWTENEDDKTIDAEDKSEANEKRTRTATDSEASVYMGEKDFEIDTIHTEEPEASVPARRLV